MGCRAIAIFDCLQFEGQRGGREWRARAGLGGDVGGVVAEDGEVEHGQASQRARRRHKGDGGVCRAERDAKAPHCPNRADLSGEGKRRGEGEGERATRRG